jgi:precorrin-6B methylase 1
MNGKFDLGECFLQAPLVICIICKNFFQGESIQNALIKLGFGLRVIVMEILLYTTEITLSG